MNHKKHLHILRRYKSRHLFRHLRHHCRMYGLYGGREEDLKEELISVVNFKYVQGLERSFRRCKIVTTEKYVMAVINGGIKDYFAQWLKWEIHRKPLSHTSEPYYKPKESLELSDFSFEKLTDNEILLVMFRMYDFSYNYISEVLNISQSYARQLYSRGIRKMRKNKKNQDLFEYWISQRAA